MDLVGEAHEGTKYRLVGRLGHSFGEVFTVRGFVAEGPQKGAEGGPNIFIQQIDDSPLLDEPIRMRVTPYFLDWNENREKGFPPVLEIGATYEFRGYETGRVVGLPADSNGSAEHPAIQSYGGHFFLSHFEVFGGKRIEPLKPGLEAFVDNTANLKGTARNKDNRPCIEGSSWTILLDGGPWAADAEGKPVTAFGAVRKLADGSYRLESGAYCYHGSLNVDDLSGMSIDSPAELTGDRYVIHRGVAILVDAPPDAKEDGWGTLPPVIAKGKLERLASPRRGESGVVFHFELRNASWEYDDRAYR